LWSGGSALKTSRFGANALAKAGNSFPIRFSFTKVRQKIGLRNARVVACENA
jgi:hypothetical protein